MIQSLNTSAHITSESPKGQRALETFRAQYNKAKLSSESAQILIEHPDFAAFLAEGIKRFSVKPYDCARTFLGYKFISPEEISTFHKGIVYTKSQLRWFRDNIPSHELLLWCRDNNYILVPGPNRPLALLEVRDLMDVRFFAYNYDKWYLQEAYVTEEKVNPEWLLLREDMVRNSIFKGWREQQQMLSEVEVTPTAVEAIWCLTIYEKMRHVEILANVHKEYMLRTSSTNHRNQHVAIGPLTDHGRHLCMVSDWKSEGNLGLSASRNCSAHITSEICP